MGSNGEQYNNLKKTTYSTVFIIFYNHYHSKFVYLIKNNATGEIFCSVMNDKVKMIKIECDLNPL